MGTFLNITNVTSLLKLTPLNQLFMIKSLFDTSLCLLDGIKIQTERRKPMKKDITKPKRNKKILRFIKKKWYLCGFLIIISLPFIQMNLNIFDTATINEKREKAQKPVFNIENGISNYLKKYETYFNDNLGFRENFIKLANTIDVKLFNKSSNSSVVLGKNDYLYAAEETDDYNRTNTLSDEQINTILTKISYFQERLSAIGIDFVFTVAPNKSTIYPEFMPYESLNENSESNLDKINNLIDDYSINYINYKKLMLDNKENYDLYYKRDTHWNLVASSLASNELLNYFKVKYNTDFGSVFPTNIRQEYNQGDLDDLLGVKTNVLETMCDISTTETKDKLPKTLVYMDSFYNTVLPCMDNFFIQRFDMHNLNAPVHSNFPIYSPNSKIVIFEMVERYLPQLLSYDFSVFNDYMDGLNIPLEETNIDLNSGTFKDVAKFTDTSPFILSSLSEDTSITWDVNLKTLDYIYLDLSELSEYKTIKLFWAKENEEFTEENSIGVLLKPRKTKYQIPISENNSDIGKIKLEFDNIDLNINSISLFTKE